MSMSMSAEEFEAEENARAMRLDELFRHVFVNMGERPLRAALNRNREFDLYLYLGKLVRKGARDRAQCVDHIVEYIMEKYKIHRENHLTLARKLDELKAIIMTMTEAEADIALQNLRKDECFSFSAGCVVLPEGYGTNIFGDALRRNGFLVHVVPAAAVVATDYNLNAKAVQDDWCCSICLSEEVKQDMVQELNCSHRFCTGCLVKYFRSFTNNRRGVNPPPTLSCPVCRTGVQKVTASSKEAWEQLHTSCGRKRTLVAETDDEVSICL